MERSDFVELINDNEELRAKNIFKGNGGVLVSYIGATDEWIVMFLDKYNYGTYAVAKARSVDLKYTSQMYAGWKEKFNVQISDPDFYTHTELKLPKFKEYDKVKLINDKPTYEKEGVKKGMIGCVMSTYAFQSEWQVIFSEEGTARDIADLAVHEDDLELIE